MAFYFGVPNGDRVIVARLFIRSDGKDCVQVLAQRRAGRSEEYWLSWKPDASFTIRTFSPAGAADYVKQHNARRYVEARQLLRKLEQASEVEA